MKRHIIPISGKDSLATAERIDDLLTVYRQTDNDEIIGCQIKGVRRKLESLKRFAVLSNRP